jgi:hypothetical protein
MIGKSDGVAEGVEWQWQNKLSFERRIRWVKLRSSIRLLYLDWAKKIFPNAHRKQTYQACKVNMQW